MSSDPKHDGLYDDVLTSHNYDGIQEYDNPMPAWWTWIFVGCCIWAGVYVVGINLNFIPDYQDDLRAEMKVQNELEAQMAATVPPLTPELLAEKMQTAGVVDEGKGVFAMNCAACHGAKGEGQIGPNLTDNAWLHGNELADIHRVVDEGVPAKGMPAWGPILTREDLIAVIAYVETMRGEDLEGKAPEGKVYGDEAPAAPADGAGDPTGANSDESADSKTAPADAPDAKTEDG